MEKDNIHHLKTVNTKPAKSDKWTPPIIKLDPNSDLVKWCNTITFLLSPASKELSTGTKLALWINVLIEAAGHVVLGSTITLLCLTGLAVVAAFFGFTIYGIIWLAFIRTPPPPETTSTIFENLLLFA